MAQSIALSFYVSGLKCGGNLGKGGIEMEGNAVEGEIGWRKDLWEKIGWREKLRGKIVVQGKIGRGEDVLVKKEIVACNCACGEKIVCIGNVLKRKLYL